MDRSGKFTQRIQSCKTGAKQLHVLCESSEIDLFKQPLSRSYVTLATQTNVVDRSRTAIECMRTTLVQLQAEIDRWMSNVLENSTELNSAKGTITKLEGQIQDMQQAHFAIWSNPDEANYSSGVGANPQTEKSAQYLDKTFLLMLGAGATDYASGTFVAGGNLCLVVHILEFLDSRMFTPHL